MSKKRKIEFAKSVETQNAEAQAARRKTIMELKAPSPEKYKVHTQLSTPNIAKTIPSMYDCFLLFFNLSANRYIYMG
jgi:hypothetical protein